MDISPWDSYTIFVFVCHFGLPHKTMQPFRNFVAILLPPTLYKVETGKNFFYTRPTLFMGRGDNHNGEREAEPFAAF